MAWAKERWQRAVAMRGGGTAHAHMPRAMEPIGLMSQYLRRINVMRADLAAVVRRHVMPALEDAAAQASRIAGDSEHTPTLDEIKKVKGGWAVFNKEGTKQLSKAYGNRAKAVKRLGQIEYFKLHGDALEPVSLDAKKTVGESIDDAQAEFNRRWPRSQMAKIAAPLSRDVPTFQANQLNRQLSAVIGSTISLDVVGSEAWLANAAAEWVNENVALIKSIPDQFFPDLEKNLTRDIADGARFEELAATLEERYGVTAAKAQLIARDQIGKYNGDLNRVRQQDLGISQFRWRTMGDERVRTDQTAGQGEGHVERNGKTYDWDDPPEGETPGEPIQCRCYAEPVVTDEDS